MSSLADNDFSCENLSDEISCGVMTYLAKKEAEKDLRLYGQFVNTSFCSKYQSYPDEQTRYDLQANGIISKNICFNPTIMPKKGEWVKQFEIFNQTGKVPYDSPCFNENSVIVDNQNKNVIPKFDIQTRPR